MSNVNSSTSAVALHVLCTEASKVAAWTGSAAGLAYAFFYWGCGATAFGALAAAAMAALVSLSFLGCVESPERVSKRETLLITCFTAAIFWGWSIVAGIAINQYADAVAFLWLGILVPPIVLTFYYWPEQADSWCGGSYPEEGTALEFMRSLFNITNTTVQGNSACPRSITFFGKQLPFEAARKLNFLVVGSIGAGKTTLLKLMMRDVLPFVKSNGKFRAVVYDAKNEMLPFLYALLSEGASIQLLNPFDRRGYAWDIAADILSASDAQSMAVALVPERSGSEAEKYFTDISRALASNAMLALSDSRGKEWGLLDVITKVLDTNAREDLLSKTAEGQLCLDNLGSYETARNSLSSVYSFFNGLIPLARLMQFHAKYGRIVSMEQWIRQPSILVLGGSESPKNSLAALNRVLIERLQAKLLDFKLNPKSKDNRTMFFLDEFSDFGQLEAAHRLMRKGREFGVCTVLAFQSVSDLQSAYAKDEQWRALLGQVGNFAFLRMNDDTTAKWAAEQIGMHPVKPAVQLSKNLDSGGTTRGTVRGGPLSYDYVIHPSRFLALPIADGDGITGFVKSGLSRIVPKLFIPWQDVIGFAENKSIRVSIPCPAEWQRISAPNDDVKQISNNENEEAELEDEEFRKLLSELKKLNPR